MMKFLKTFFLISCCFLSYLTYKVYQKPAPTVSEFHELDHFDFEQAPTDVKQKEFHLYKKNKDDIESIVANEAESEKLKNLLNSRGPAAIKTPQRDFLGKEFPMEELKFTNSIDADWKEKLGTDLLRFQTAETKASIHSEKSFIKTDSKKNARFVEQVLITFFLTTGEQNSYNALIDSETGQVIKTWNRVIAEKNTNLLAN